jgi:signal recognition particle receptor subunit beta
VDEYKLASEFLYDLLVHPALRRDARMMIACNKSDMKSARNADEMTKILNLQIERLRKSRMEGNLEGDNAVDQYLGVDGEEFDLEAHSPIPVEFATASVAQSKVSDIEVFTR